MLVHSALQSSPTASRRAAEYTVRSIETKPAISEPTLTLRDLQMVVPASLLYIYCFFLFLNTMQSFKQYLLEL